MSTSSDSLFSSLPESLQKLIDEVFTSVANPNAVPKRSNTQKARVDGSRASTAAVTGGGFIVDDTDNVPSTPPVGGGGFILDDTSTGGGFIVDDTASLSGGGFITGDTSSLHVHDSDTEPDTIPSQVPFSLIPTALYRLDLPGDDPEILGVLRNAAGGWTSSSVPAPSSGDVGDADSNERGSNLYVDRADWRSVCAVLLESRADEFKSMEPEAPLRQRRQRPTRSSRATASSDVDAMEVDDEDEDEDISDIYVEEDEDAAGSDADFRDEEDDDEFLPGSKRATRSSKGKKRAERDISSSPPPRAVPGKPTRRQRDEALEAFGLFFTSRNNKDKAAGLENIPKEDIPNQRLKLSHLQAAATLLGERFKAEEMVDMLEMFSTAPDKSMNLDDFTRMMIATKLV
ncbi:hypothetical protein D9619_005752 [Psilocybe cf. subviscida]|uniref:EF-hand domain-containing protein n=1 Tax=Psilocybe cf. subviscida TaxID=2480587 RepID=A0A8H5BXB9_9AGAR|nr:hypothetical protein D9619_005752 [Psilocybe cf. subviscida]